MCDVVVVAAVAVAIPNVHSPSVILLFSLVLLLLLLLLLHPSSPFFFLSQTKVFKLEVPSDDESSGTLDMGWRGPSVESFVGV
jgi:hypothetical protein